MGFEPEIAVLDACILYPFHVRNIIVQAAVDHLVEARWTDEIHNEWCRSLAADVPTLPMARLSATRRLMDEALPMATVSGYEDLIPTLHLPDPDDRHVLAATIAAGASTILTWNLRDFPTSALKTYGVRRQTPDSFLTGLYDDARDLIVGSLANARRNLTASRVSASDFIDILANQRFTRLSKHLKMHQSEL